MAVECVSDSSLSSHRPRDRPCSTCGGGDRRPSEERDRHDISPLSSLSLEPPSPHKFRQRVEKEGGMGGPPSASYILTLLRSSRQCRIRQKKIPDPAPREERFPISTTHVSKSSVLTNSSLLAIEQYRSVA